MERGEIYYIDIPHATGQEIDKARPGVIVSRNERNRTSRTVQVAFCSSKTREDAPEHITIRSTPKESVVLCDHIYTVDESRIGTYLGRVTNDEMERIDTGLMIALHLGGGAASHF